MPNMDAKQHEGQEVMLHAKKEVVTCGLTTGDSGGDACHFIAGYHCWNLGATSTMACPAAAGQVCGPLGFGDFGDARGGFGSLRA